MGQEAGRGRARPGLAEELWMAALEKLDAAEKADGGVIIALLRKCGAWPRMRRGQVVLAGHGHRYPESPFCAESPP